MEFWQKALGYLQAKEGYKLTKEEKEKIQRCKQIKYWITQHGISEAINMGVMDFELSERQVRRIFNDAVKIFGDDTQLSKNFLLQIVFDDIRKTKRLAEEANDLKVMAQCEKNMLTLIKDHFGDADTPDFDKVQVPQTIIMYKPELLGFEPLAKNELDRELAILTRPRRKKEVYEDAEIIEENDKPSTL